MYDKNMPDPVLPGAPASPLSAELLPLPGDFLDACDRFPEMVKVDVVLEDESGYDVYERLDANPRFWKFIDHCSLAAPGKDRSPLVCWKGYDADGNTVATSRSNVREAIFALLPDSALIAAGANANIVQFHVADPDRGAWHVFVREARGGWTLMSLRNAFRPGTSDDLPMMGWRAFDTDGQFVTDSGAYRGSPRLHDPAPPWMNTTDKAALFWLSRRALDHLAHVMEKVGDLPDQKFENIDPFYLAMRNVVGLIRDCRALLDDGEPGLLTALDDG